MTQRSGWGWLIALVLACLSAGEPAVADPVTATPIQHVIVIMLEKASFDHYFGTYPGATGFPLTDDGGFAVCVPDPATATCVAPYHNPSPFFKPSSGGPLGSENEIDDIDGGAMDGFIRTAETKQASWPAQTCGDPAIAGCTIDTMSYHTDAEFPNYWAYARNFVLQDHMFAATLSYGLPAHLAMVSGWSAVCASHDPASCTAGIDMSSSNGRIDAWTDITWLLHAAGVSWGYYVNAPPAGVAPCYATLAKAYTPYIWNPLVCFDTVLDSDQFDNIQPVSNFTKQALAGTLPSVSWLAPNWARSDHQGSSSWLGQQFVTQRINDVMNGPLWSSSAIFVTWSNSGGFYDHVPPPSVDAQGYGLRVPGLLISPYARAGLIDTQVLSSDAYLKFIEDNWLGGQRLDPATDGRPDPRPGVRENAPLLGDLMAEFDFTQAPLPPLILSTAIPPAPPPR